MTKDESLYFEDFSVGQQFPSGSFTFDRDHAIAFAKEYDPQYFHIDEEAAKKSFFGKLAVSGWQTAAVTMKLKAASDLRKVAGGLIGLGHESLNWPRSVYPGDTVRIVVTVMDKRPSKSKPRFGILKYKTETFNQRDEVVMEMMTSVLVPRRPA